MRKGGVERPSWPNPGTLQDPFSNLLCSHVRRWIKTSHPLH
uniref:ORF40e n=1 Tax=Pinus thunbergii TaxID=3350 RepID=Q32991_PINTH|nr:ORF40e [Pinus thunbergii]